MIGDGTVIMAEAKTACAARTAGQSPVFEAHPLLLSGDGPATIGKNIKAFRVCNTSAKRVCIGDRLPVAKTMQGHFVTVAMQVGRAMSVIFVKDGSDWTVDKYWEGEDPEICGDPVVECLLGCDCLKDGDKVYARYSPEDDKYYAISSASALLGAGKNVDVMVDSDGGEQTGLFRWSTGNCGELEYATKTIKVFDCGETDDDDPTVTPKTAAWNGEVIPVMVGATITTNGEGDPCISFATRYALVCATSGGASEPILLCGENCCDEVVYHKRYDSPGSVPSGETVVGTYTFGPYALVDTVVEACHLPDDAPAGWTAGAGETLGTGFARTNPSPECCTEEAPA